MHDDEKMLYRIYACVWVMLLWLAFNCCLSCRNSSGLQGGTDRETGRIEEQQRQAGVEISRAGAEVESAEESIGRADGAISDSQKRAAAMQEGLSECEAILKECQELAGRNAKIIGELREQTGSRAQAAGQ